MLSRNVQEIRDEVKAYLQTANINAGEVSKLMAAATHTLICPSMIEAFLDGTYKGNEREIAVDLKLWLMHEQQNLIEKMGSWSLWHETDVLKSFVDNMPKNSQTRVAFDYFMPSTNLPESLETPPKDSLRACIKTFMRMPESERRKVLNGWDYKPGWPSRKSLVKWVANQADWEVMPVVALEVGDKNVTFESQHAIASAVTSTKVEMQIHFGTSKAEALAAIRNAYEAVEKHWDDLPGISSNFGTCSVYPIEQQKSGVLNTPDTNSVSSRNGGKAKKSAAA